MSSTRPPESRLAAASRGGARTNSRDKISRNRLSVEELEEVESGRPKRSGKSLAEGSAIPSLREARQRPDARSNRFWQSFRPAAASPARSPQQVTRRAGGSPVVQAVADQALARIEAEYVSCSQCGRQRSRRNDWERIVGPMATMKRHCGS